jgi:hypothetical protein
MFRHRLTCAHFSKETNLIATLSLANQITRQVERNVVNKLKKLQDVGILGNSIISKLLSTIARDNAFQYVSLPETELSRKWIGVFRSRVRDRFYESKVVKLISIYPVLSNQWTSVLSTSLQSLLMIIPIQFVPSPKSRTRIENLMKTGCRLSVVAVTWFLKVDATALFPESWLDLHEFCHHVA